MANFSSSKHLLLKEVTWTRIKNIKNVTKCRDSRSVLKYLVPSEIVGPPGGPHIWTTQSSNLTPSPNTYIVLKQKQYLWGLLVFIDVSINLPLFLSFVLLLSCLVVAVVCCFLVSFEHVHFTLCVILPLWCSLTLNTLTGCPRMMARWLTNSSQGSNAQHIRGSNYLEGSKYFCKFGPAVQVLILHDTKGVPQRKRTCVQSEGGACSCCCTLVHKAASKGVWGWSRILLICAYTTSNWQSRSSTIRGESR